MSRINQTQTSYRMTVDEHIAEIEKHFEHWNSQPKSYLRDLIVTQLYVDWNYAQALKRISDQLGEVDALLKIHECPPDGSGLTPCCGKSPLELPRTDRMTADPKQVTCKKPQ